MKWNELSMADRARYIKLGVENGLSSIEGIRKVYNEYTEVDRANKYDGKSMDTQQMERVNYYDPITGENYGNVLPEGKVKVTSFNQLTPQAQDEYMANRATALPDLVVYPKSEHGARSTTIGSYYDTVNNMTEANREHAARVAEMDAIVRETSAFEKPLNFLSLGQWVGAYINYKQGESPFWKGIYNGNSGWVTDEFARENPRASLLLNMLGDAVVGYGADKVTSKFIPDSFYRSVESPRLTSSMRRAFSPYNEIGIPLQLQEMLTDKQLGILNLVAEDARSRLISALSDEGYIMTNSEKELVRNLALDEIKFFVDEPSKDSGILGSSYTKDYKIGIPMDEIQEYGFSNYRIPMDEIITHEIEHSQRNILRDEASSSRLRDRGKIEQRSKIIRNQLDESKIYTNKESKLLDDAYNFSDDYLDTHEKISPIREKGATNRQFREQLIRETGLIGDELDAYIDKMSDIELIERLKKINGYSRDFYNDFINKYKLEDDPIPDNIIEGKANAIRKALKYVAMIDSNNTTNYLIT